MRVSHCVVAVALTVAAGSASAGVLSMSWEGQLTDITDPDNLFGGATDFRVLFEIDSDAVDLNSSADIGAYGIETASLFVGGTELASGPSLLQIAPDGVTGQSGSIGEWDVQVLLDGTTSQIFSTDALPAPQTLVAGVDFPSSAFRGLIRKGFVGPAMATPVLERLVITPAPSGVALLGLAGIAAARRRR